jgi:hypothetical protein
MSFADRSLVFVTNLSGVLDPDRRSKTASMIVLPSSVESIRFEAA